MNISASKAFPRSSRIGVRTLILTTVAAAVSCSAFAQTPAPAPAPQQVNLADQADLYGEIANRAKATNTLSPGRVFIVSGDTTFSSQLLTAREIHFKPNSRLIFVDSGPNTSSHFFIVADKIVVEDVNHPGTISWQRSVPPKPSDRGQAGSGVPGGGEGAAGGAGAQGAPGITGTAGANAPEITVMVRNVGAGGLVVDDQGGMAGDGGIGQAGGNGGNGAQGGPARQARKGGPFGTTIWLPYCDAGPGQGGSGGVGGNGGPGGLGGQGGNGGNVTLVSTPLSIPTLFQAIRVNLGGGAGGNGGQPGIGGKGGFGGPEGALANFCNSAGRQGSPGGAGPSGPQGTNGQPGRAGQPFVSNLTDAQFAALFGF